MTDSALILGLAGIGGTVTVGIASPWIAAHFAGRQQRRTFEHERTMRDSEELRQGLDDFAARLEDCNSAMDAARREFLRSGRKIGLSAGLATLDELHTASEGLRHVAGRLAVRLGEDHPVTRPAADAQLALGTFSDAIMDVAALGDQADLPRQEARMQRGRQDFDRARSAFVEAASTYAGATLPVERSRR